MAWGTFWTIVVQCIIGGGIVTAFLFMLLVIAYVAFEKFMGRS